MTNKEALSYLANKVNIGDPIEEDFDDKAYGCFEQLHNELEKLEIVKKWFIENIEDYSFSKYPNYWVKKHYIYENSPIFNVIKEWLGNGRT